MNDDSEKRSSAMKDFLKDFLFEVRYRITEGPCVVVGKYQKTDPMDGPQRRFTPICFRSYRYLTDELDGSFWANDFGSPRLNDYPWVDDVARRIKQIADQYWPDGDHVVVQCNEPMLRHSLERALDRL